MKKRLLGGCLLLSLFSPLLHATDLMEIYRQSLTHDPIFKKAYSTYMSTREALPQALSVLLPQVTITSQVQKNLLILADNGYHFYSPFNSLQWQLNATQTIFNYQAWSQVQQAKAEVKRAQAIFNDAAQDLILRTANAYFKILLTQDTLNFAEAKLRANKRQLDQAEDRFKFGVETITSVYEAKAAYDRSTAEVIAAKNNQINQNENLYKLTNHTYVYLAPLRNAQIPLIHPEPNNADLWIDTALKQNYKLFAAKFNIEEARENIKALSAGNWPTVAIQSNVIRQVNDLDYFGDPATNFFTPGQQTYSTFGLTMNFPVFQGGLVASQTRQAQYDFQSMSEQFEQVYRDVIANSRIAFNTIVDGISKVKADRQTVISQKNSLDSTEIQFQAGTRTMLDVTIAQQRLFEAQEELATDQYNLITAILNLKYLAGTLNVNDLQEVNAWLDTTRIPHLPPH